MKIIYMMALVTGIALTGISAHATSNSEICNDSEGIVEVKDGNVTIKEGIGDVGPATTQKVIAEISETTENCVEGPNYVWTTVTVQEVTYDIEENVKGSAVVLCTKVQTGIDSSCN